MPRKPIRVLIVDDSALVRTVLKQGLDMDPAIEVVGVAPDPYVARDRILELKPEVLTLDVEMPRMDGVEFLRRLMPQYPLPTVMVSSLTEKGKAITLASLEAGAVDFVTKPSADLKHGLSGMLAELRTKIKIASTANVSHWKHKRPAARSRASAPGLTETTDKVIAIGASTGGTEAIRTVLQGMPVSAPGIVVVQHMPGGFTRMFSERLNSLCRLEVKEAEEGDRIMPGRALIAPGGKHMTVKRSGGLYQVSCRAGQPVNGHCPSVDVLFQSVAVACGKNAVGVMLTGMGADGADAMKLMRDAGARTLAQDEKTSVVFGMPKEAYRRGAAERLVPLESVGQEVLNLLARMN